MGISYMDDNSIPVSTDNMASSQAMNPNNIVERASADASENTPLIFSGDPVIEANMHTKAKQQAMLMETLKSSIPSGAMNKDCTETGEDFVGLDVRQEW